MKLNHRDKLLLIGVFVVLIWVAGIMLFIKPAIDSMKGARDTLDAKEIELSGLQDRIKQDENLKDDVQKAFDQTNEIADVFYDVLVQHEAMTIVQSQFDFDPKFEGQEIKNLDLSISGMQVTDLKKYKEKDDQKLSQAQIIIDGVGDVDTSIIENVVNVNNYTMEFSFEAKKKDLITFLENLQTNADRSLVVSSLKISDVLENEDDTEFSGDMSLDFMMLPRLKSPEEVQEAEKSVNVSE